MSTSSSVTSTTVNGTTRITGLASGLDVDSIVTQLMSAEKIKLNKLQQKQQLAEWRQESYRTIIAAAQEFTSKYFNTTSSSSLLSANAFIKYSVTSSSLFQQFCFGGESYGTSKPACYSCYSDQQQQPI